MTVLCESFDTATSNGTIADSLASTLGLEIAVQRAEELIAADDLPAALDAWDRIAEIAGRIFGANDATAIDAERISAAILVRLGRTDEAHAELRAIWSRLEEMGGDRDLQVLVEGDIEDLVSVGPTAAPSRV